jgi:UPF0716 family protein affecting phage T7 exclusion
LPLAVGVVVIGVWLTLVIVIVRTVRGVLADAPGKRRDQAGAGK